ncbi:MAG: trigger factor, partial [Candidatus Zixiibacteriota bacterium]
MTADRNMTEGISTKSSETDADSGVTCEIISSVGLKRTFRVEATAAQVAEAFASEYRKIQKRTTLKGFRKGKAPLMRIRSLFAGEARADVVDRLLQKSYHAAISKLELNVAGPPQVTQLTLEENEPLSFTADVEVFPKIERVDLSGLTYVDRFVDVTEADVNRVIEQLRRRNTPPLDVERPARENDLITADLEKTEDKSDILKGDTFPDSEIDLSNDMTVREFREGLLGVARGEERTIRVEYPADYPDKPFAGQSLTYRIT